MPPPLSTAAQVVANNAVVTAVARIAMFLTPILVTIALFVLSGYLAAQSKAMDELRGRVTSVESVDGSFGTRITVLETGAARADQQAVAVQNKLDKIVDTVTDIRTDVATVKARLPAQ